MMVIGTFCMPLCACVVCRQRGKDEQGDRPSTKADDVGKHVATIPVNVSFSVLI
jgi:hypothetical protein